MQTAQRNQRLLVGETIVLASFREVLALVTSQIRTLETAIAALIAADPLWQKRDQAFRSVKGVADRTVARLMAEMPEIGTALNKAIPKLAGLAPLARDSAKSQDKRPVRGGGQSSRSGQRIRTGDQLRCRSKLKFLDKPDSRSLYVFHKCSF